jgi:prepilin-type N-terminal cleavage/methylation domain-containing protein/prepilin-type processing-associated H-X9-DG protein
MVIWEIPVKNKNLASLAKHPLYSVGKTMKSSKKVGFTLVELLVVIAIIALLMGILMPALSKARMQAQRIVCASNLRQQHTACSMYVDDFDGNFPHVQTDDLTATSYFLWGGKKGLEGRAQSSVRLLNPYVFLQGEVDTNTEDSRLHVFKCPADKGQTGGNHNHERRPTVWDHVGCSYLPNFTANSNIHENNEGLWGKKLTRVRNPHTLIMVRDFSFLAYFRSPEGSYDGEPFGYFYWHDNKENGWGNVTFVDGHTKYLLATQNKPDYQNGDGWTFLKR